jgi:hypothetical protein
MLSSHRRYLKLRDTVDGHHTSAPKLEQLELPYQARHWRRAHTETVLGAYPELTDTVRQIEELSKLRRAPH